MIKLILGKGLEEREANCNFCGEQNKQCIKGSVPNKFSFDVVKYEWKTVILRWREIFYSEDKVIKEHSDTVKIIKNIEPVIKELSVDICKDCIRQLAKLV